MKNKFKELLRKPILWIKQLYDWTIQWSRSKKAPYALFAIAFIESSFFPIPPDVLLIAMVVSHRHKWARHAIICTIGSVLGGMFGYFIGWSLFEIIGRPLVNLYHMQDIFNMIGQKYAENAFLVIFTAAFTPIPYKAITISSGLFEVSFSTLVIASIIGRAGRFFLVAGALRVFGKKVQDSVEKYFDILSIVFVLLLIAGFVLMKYIFK